MPVAPYAIPIGGVIEISAEFKLNGQQNINLFHYVWDGNVPIEDGPDFLLNLADQWNADDAVGDLYPACISSDAGQISYYAQLISPARYAYVPLGPAVDPTYTAGAAPQNVAAVITKKGLAATRAGVGTLHLGGVPASKIIGGEIVQGEFDQPYDNLAIALPLPLTVGGQSIWPILFNRTTPADSQYIVSAFLQPTSRVMRRRTVGLGI